MNHRDVLQPHSVGAGRTADLLWVLLIVALAVVALVAALVLVSAYRSRRARDTTDDPRVALADHDPRRGVRFVVGAGVVFPVVVLAGVFALTLGPMSAASDLHGSSVQIDVTAHRWWWDVRYEGTAIRTANEIHVPVGQKVLIRLRTADVIHSFWVPELGGKIDAIPGQVNQLLIHPTAVGTFGGSCAEFCGLEHARMRFQVVVDRADDFRSWERQMQRPPRSDLRGDELAGRQVFLSSACVYCHAVEGTNASSHLGPDLTHLASRRTLAAGVIANRPGQLAGWLLDPQSIKPGTLMPAMDLPPHELQQLLAYLDSLE